MAVHPNIQQHMLKTYTAQHWWQSIQTSAFTSRIMAPSDTYTYMFMCTHTKKIFKNWRPGGTNYVGTPWTIILALSLILMQIIRQI